MTCSHTQHASWLAARLRKVAIMANSKTITAPIIRSKTSAAPRNLHYRFSFRLMGAAYCTESKKKNRSFHLRMPGKLSAVPLGDLTGDKQPQAETVGLGAHGGAEQLLADRRRPGRGPCPRREAARGRRRRNTSDQTRGGTVFAGQRRVQGVQHKVRHKLTECLGSPSSASRSAEGVNANSTPA